MYGKKQKKVSEYGLNQINKRVLLSVPKLIIVGEGIPTLMTSLGIPMTSPVRDIPKTIS